MAKIVLQSNASGNGTLTITAPSTNTDFTLNIPAESGSLLTSTNLSEINVASNTLVANSTAVVVNEDGNDVDFRVEGDTDANLLFVDAGNDRVGVGTSSPGYNLDVKGTIATTYSTTVKGGFTAGSGSVFLATLTNHPLIFETNGSERMRLNTSGNLAFPNGGGIDFSASAGGGASSSILDDYEEGTFTPTLTPASGSTPLQGSYDTLSYTKIGRVVTITGQIVAGTPSSATGTLTLGNLPFAQANIEDLAGQVRPSMHIFCNGGGAPASGYFSAFIAFSEGGTSGVIVVTYNATYNSTISNWIGVGSDFFVNFSYITT